MAGLVDSYEGLYFEAGLGGRGLVNPADPAGPLARVLFGGLGGLQALASVVQPPVLRSFTLTAGNSGAETGFKIPGGQFGSISQEPLEGEVFSGFYRDSSWGLIYFDGDVVSIVEDYIPVVDGTPVTGSNVIPWQFGGGFTQIQFQNPSFTFVNGNQYAIAWQAA